MRLGHTGTKHVRRLCGLELLGAMAGSSQEKRMESRSKVGGMSALKEREQFSESGNSWYGGHGRLCNHPHL